MIKKKYPIKEYIIVGALILSPMFLYAYLLIPKVNEVIFLSYLFEITYYTNLHYFIWALNVQLNLLILLFVWFFTNKHWWRFAIIPIMIHSFSQVILILNDEFKFFIAYDHWHVIFVGFMVIPLFMFLHRLLKYKPLSFSEKVEINANDKLIELIEFDKKRYINLYEAFTDLRNKKSKYSEKDYLCKMIAIQTAIEGKIIAED